MPKEHLETASGNAVYISKTVQNELITICGNVILNKLLRKIHNANAYSVIADEATDATDDERLTVSIWYVDGGLPYDKWLALQECIKYSLVFMEFLRHLSYKVCLI